MSPTITRRSSWLAAAVVATTLLATPGTARADEAPAAPAGYELLLLKAPDGYTSAAALGINDDGTVVGAIRPTTRAQPQEAALWPSGSSTATPLPQLDGSQFARAFDIAANGTIVGEAFNAGGNSVPVAWRDGISQLPSPSPTGLGVAWDVADNGTVLATTYDGTKTVSYTTRGDGFSLLADPTSDGRPASGWRATSISDSGDYQVGIATIAVPHGNHTHDERLLGIWHDDHVHLYEMDESLDIDPKGINDDAVVVGATTSNRISRAARWVQGAYERLADPAIEGFPHSSANAINNLGVVVGSATKFAGNASFGGVAVAWFGTRVVDLNTKTTLPEGVSLLSASDINAKGQIVGTATTPAGQAGFILTPIPAQGPHPSATPQPTPPVSSPAQPAPSPSPTSAPAKPTPGRPGLPASGR